MTQPYRILSVTFLAAALLMLPGKTLAQWAYATSPDANLVSVIDPSHGTVARTISTPFSSGAVAVTPDGQTAYVVNYCTAADRNSGAPGSVTVCFNSATLPCTTTFLRQRSTP